MDKCTVKHIKRMAWKYILHKGLSQKEVGEKYGLSGSTVSKYFSKHLPEISPFLSKQVQKRIEKNRELSRKAFVKNVVKK